MQRLMRSKKHTEKKQWNFIQIVLDETRKKKLSSRKWVQPMKLSQTLRRRLITINLAPHLVKGVDDLEGLNEDSVHRDLGDLVIYLSNFLMVVRHNHRALTVEKMRKQNSSSTLQIVINDESLSSSMIATTYVAHVKV